MARFATIGVSAFLMACTAMAQCTGGGSEAKAASCSGEKSAAKCCDKGGEKAVAVKLPAMSYKVGDKETACPNEAEELAKAGKAKVQFVVDGKTYAEKAEANEAYAKQLESFMEESMAVKYAVGDACVSCPMTAGEMAKKENKKVQYRVASFTFEKQDDADKAVKQAKEAAEKVSMKWMVGEKCFTCPVEATKAAKSDGKQVDFVVGDVKTQCDKQARVNLAKARIEAAMKAMSEQPGIAKA